QIFADDLTKIFVIRIFEHIHSRTISRHRAVELFGASCACAENFKCTCKIVLRHSPFERHALARLLCERLAIGLDRLLQPHCAALALAKHSKHTAEIGLCRGPLEWHALARLFLERIAKSFDRLLQPRRAALTLAEL